MAAHKYPIGIQTFSKLREGNFVYIDKTALIHKMVTDGSVYFLSRPRRFGKSLLISTLESYFKGQKDLFKGLAIEKLEKDWLEYPVFHFDMSGSKHHGDLTMLNESLDMMLRDYEKIYGREAEITTFSVRLGNLIKRAYEQTGKPAVILIDEYDTPLLDTLIDHDTFEKARLIMRDFYSPLKKCDNLLKFVFLTGITKFSQLSIFSELNNLKNISMLNAYAGICGITKEELLENFKEDIGELAAKQGLSFDDALAKLKKKYDGYHFSSESPDIFNPFSLLNCLSDCDFGSYWFSTGTPTFLTEQISEYSFAPEDYDKGVWLPADAFDAPTETATTPIPVMYQAGYLTIKEYDREDGSYRLAFPNDEVRMGFLKGLVPYYIKKQTIDVQIFIRNFSMAFRNDDPDEVMRLLRAFLASIPYDAEKQDEDHYKTICYLLCRLVTSNAVATEQRTAAGRADVVVETKKSVFCFEFKLDGSAQAALEQIDQKGYLIPYEVSGKKLFKIGVNVGQESRTIDEWIVK